LQRPPYYLNGTEDRARRKRRLGETDPTARLGAGELGDSLGALGDGMLGELAGEDEADGGLDLVECDGGLLVVPCQLGRLRRQLLEDVLDEEFMMDMALDEMPMFGCTASAP